MWFWHCNSNHSVHLTRIRFLGSWWILFSFSWFEAWTSWFEPHHFDLNHKNTLFESHWTEFFLYLRLELWFESLIFMNGIMWFQSQIVWLRPLKWFLIYFCFMILITWFSDSNCTSYTKLESCITLTLFYDRSPTHIKTFSFKTYHNVRTHILPLFIWKFTTHVFYHFQKRFWIFCKCLQRISLIFYFHFSVDLNIIWRFVMVKEILLLSLIFIYKTSWDFRYL